MLVHLISRRRFDVVEWGNAVSGARAEDEAKNSPRGTLPAPVADGADRHWFCASHGHGSQGWATRFSSPLERDVVFVLDSSYSMAWDGDGQTPHAAAIQWIHHFLDDLQPGDTVALLDSTRRGETRRGPTRWGLFTRPPEVE